jgi:hypothetical protein
MMRGGRLTAGLLLVAAVLVAAVPVLREGFIQVVQGALPGGGLRTMPDPDDLEPVARAHPDDAQVWLAYAVAVDSTAVSARALAEIAKAGAAGQVTAPDDAATGEAWQKALQLGGDSPAALLRGALHYLGQGGQLREPGHAAPPASDLERAAQAANRGKARDLLLRCRTLAPDNAAPDYYLAWTYLAAEQAPQALDALRAAAAKPHWSTYQPEVGLAMLRLVEGLRLPRGLRGIAAQALIAGGYFPTLAQLRSLTRVVVAMGDEARERGDSAEALACYGAMLHLGSTMRTEARTIIDGLVGIAVSAISTGSVLSKADLERVAAQARDGDERVRLTWEARTTAFAVYAREHGRDDLARLAEDERVQGRQWKEEARAVSGQMVPRLIRQVTGGGVPYAAAVWLTLAALSGVMVIAGLWSLALRHWREPRLPAPCGYPGWLGLLVALVAPGLIAAAVFTRVIGEHALDEPSYPEPQVWALMGSGVVLWMAVVLVLAMRRRGRLPVEGRPGRFRSYLGALRALLPPTLAALLVLSALGFGLLQSNLRAMDDQQRAVMQQGEVKYWGIGTGKVSAEAAGNSVGLEQ